MMYPIFDSHYGELDGFVLIEGPDDADLKQLREEFSEYSRRDLDKWKDFFSLMQKEALDLSCQGVAGTFAFWLTKNKHFSLIRHKEFVV